MHMSEPTLKSNSCLAWHTERFTYERPNTIELSIYKRTIHPFFLRKKKVEMQEKHGLPMGGSAYIPKHECGALRRDLVKHQWRKEAHEVYQHHKFLEWCWEK
jgi:hypothetical protein